MHTFGLPSNDNSFLFDGSTFSSPSSDMLSPRLVHHDHPHRNRKATTTRHPFGDPSARANARPGKHRADKVMQSSPLRNKCGAAIGAGDRKRSGHGRATSESDSGGWELFGELIALSQSDPQTFITSFLLLASSSRLLSSLPTSVQVSLLLFHLPKFLAEAGRDHIARHRISGNHNPITLEDVALTCCTTPLPSSSSLALLSGELPVTVEKRRREAEVHSVTVVRMGALSTELHSSPGFSTPPRRFTTITQRRRQETAEDVVTPFMQIRAQHLGSPLRIETSAPLPFAPSPHIFSTSPTSTSDISSSVNLYSLPLPLPRHLFASSTFGVPLSSASSFIEDSPCPLPLFASANGNAAFPSFPSTIDTPSTNDIESSSNDVVHSSYSITHGISMQADEDDLSNLSLPPLDAHATPPPGPRMTHVPFFVDSSTFFPMRQAGMTVVGPRINCRVGLQEKAEKGAKRAKMDDEEEKGEVLLVQKDLFGRGSGGGLGLGLMGVGRL